MFNLPDLIFVFIYLYISPVVNYFLLLKIIKYCRNYSNGYLCEIIKDNKNKINFLFTIIVIEYQKEGLQLSYIQKHKFNLQI